MKNSMMRMMLVTVMLMMMMSNVYCKCRVQHLGFSNYARSDTIVSATVMSFYMKSSGGASGGRIKIKRVFRGDRGLEGRLVVVEGYGNRNICLSNPRLGDTKLFFLKMGKMRQDISGQALKFKLNDNILKINSRNLKTLIKLRDRKRIMKKKQQKMKKQFCDVNQLAPDCVREPRAIKMMSDSVAVTPSPLPLLSLPTPPPSPCSFSPCEAGGSCEEHDGTFSCHCLAGRSGRYCEQETDITDTEAGFTGDSFIMMAPLSNSVTRTNIQLSFRTFQSEAVLLLWLGHTDWLSIAIVRAHLVVKYELGSGPGVLISRAPVRLGQWHTMQFSRYRQDGRLQVDREEPVTTRSRGRNKSLNIKDNIYLGGHPLTNTSSYLTGTDKGLVGCIRNVNIMRKNVRLVEDVKVRRKIILCSEHPCREGYCANNGECLVRSSRPVCECDRQWRGRRCLKRRKKNKRRHKKYHANDTIYFKDKSHKRRRNRKRRKGRYYRSRY